MVRFIRLGLIGMAAPAAIGIPALVHYIKQPTNFGERLTWNGGTHLGQGDDQKNTWKAKFNDYGEHVKSVVTTYSDNAEATDDHISKLKSWCVEEAGRGINSEKYERYESLCSTSLRTMKGKFIAGAQELPSQDEDWKIIFLNNKHIPSFLGRLVEGGGDGTSLTSSSSASDGYSRVRTLCENWFKESTDSENVGEARLRCLKPTVVKVGDKLGRIKGFKKITEDDDYERASKKWKNESSYATVVTGTDGQDDKSKLRKYCEEQMGKKLSELSDYDKDIQRIRSYCDATGLGGDSKPK